MKNNSKRGFTLIELLVVIAIIGILSAVVLASLTTARTRGNDTAVKSNLVTVRTQADLFYSNNNNSYGTFSAATCPTTTGGSSVFGSASVVASISAALAAGGTGTRCVASDTAYAVAVGLKTPGESWCVDSLGRSKQFTGTPTAAITGFSCN